MGVVIRLRHRHAPASMLEREAKDARRSAVTPSPAARGVPKRGTHQSAGMLLRCHHFETAKAEAPTSDANASRESQSSITDRKDVRSRAIVHNVLGHFVLKRKSKLSLHSQKKDGQDVVMVGIPQPSDFKRQFLRRVKEARKARFTQEKMAGFLGMNQGTYKQYETRSYLPYHLIPTFCDLCGIAIKDLFAPLASAVPKHPSPPKNAQKRISRAKRPAA